MRKLNTKQLPLTSRHKRGVSLLIFLLVIVPVFLLGVALAIDISSLINQMDLNRNVAEAAAQAGATARDLNTGGVDQAQAAARAQSVCARAVEQGCTAVSFPNPYLVSVTIKARPYDLYSDSFLPPWANPFRINWDNMQTTEVASICNSVAGVGESDQYCVRPSGS